MERTMGSIRHHFWPGRTFTDLADLNRQLLQWLDTVANVRPHGTIQERPLDRLATEHLEPLPDPARWAPYLFETRTVSRDGFVAYGGSRYGVPWTVAGQPITVEDCGDRLVFRVDGVMVAEHPRAPVPGSVNPLRDQWHGLPQTDPVPTRTGRAQQIPTPDVEVRDLEEYARIGGTISCSR
ncbi:ISChy4, transposase [Sulfobacillus acidophilus TPY]|nr:ISChy4, transposase [Sulfobacillus acidophilus TPY]